MDTIADNLSESEELKRALKRVTWLARETETALTELDQIFNTSADGLLVVDKEFRILRMNDTFSQMFGIEKAKSLGKPCHEALDACAQGADLFPMQRILDGEERVEFETTMRNADGTEIPCIVTVTPFTGRDGSVIGAIEDFKDITERKKAEEKIKESERIKTEFMNVAAHELKTPIIPVRGYLEMILRKGELPDDTKKWIQICLRSTTNLIDLINVILDVARLESNMLKLLIERVDLGAIVDDVGTDMEPAIVEKNLQLVIEKPDQLATVQADKKRMAQVLRNLVSNAIKCTEEGSITIRAQQDNDQIMVSVKDTGMGIAPENVSKLFQKFSQLDEVETRRVEGTGLGLYICKGIVEKQGGRIWVESEGEGKGSTFSFRLPVDHQ
ncbi:PAS domain S-box protein [bacterium]|nr:PAS domain S-box protein [bacterium]